jgi:hypothetical protein
MSGELYVAWRSGDTVNGRWGPVGHLAHDENIYRFVYTQGARTIEGFSPFPGMPDLDAVYESETLFPLFTNRLLSRSRPEYEAFLSWSGFDPNCPPDPISILSVTEGRRATDAIEVFPCPSQDATGCYLSKFFLHGIRWMHKDARSRVDRLTHGDTLGLLIDISNTHDPHAVAVRTCDIEERLLIGYVPRYLARDVRELCHRCGPNCLKLTVERVNIDAPLQQRLLCKMASCWPSGFSPCSGDEFKPIVTAGLIQAR